MKNRIRDKRATLKKQARDDKPRDDLKGAFAGYENKGPSAKHKKRSQRGTKQRERKVSSKLAPGVTPKV